MMVEAGGGGALARGELRKDAPNRPDVEAGRVLLEAQQQLGRSVPQSHHLSREERRSGGGGEERGERGGAREDASAELDANREEVVVPAVAARARRSPRGCTCR